MENKIEYSKPVPPFVKFCAANIPMVFDDSLSYYEALCALWKFLQSDVIDVINNNAQVTQVWREELTEFEGDMTDKFNDLNDAFDTLKTWVETYFDNLDVQEEINNKLDEMAEQGVLADIISQYLNSTAIFGFDNVADMKSADNLTNGSFARTLGYYAKNDGGAGLYKIRTITNTDIPDNGSIIAMNDNTLVAELIISDNQVNVKQFGANGDGITDDTAAIQSCFNCNADVFFVPEGNYKITSKLIMPLNKTLKGTNANTCVIKVTDFDDYAIQYGTSYNYASKRGKIENIRIESINTPTNNYSYGIYLNSGCELNNVYLNHLKQGISKVSNYIDNIILFRCHITYCGGKENSYVVDLPSNGDAIRITQCQFGSGYNRENYSDYLGIRIQGSTGFLIDNNIINAPILLSNCKGTLVNNHMEGPSTDDHFNFSNIKINNSNIAIDTLYIHKCLNKPEIEIQNENANSGHNATVSMTNVVISLTSLMLANYQDMSAQYNVYVGRQVVLNIDNCFNQCDFTAGWGAIFPNTGLRIKDENGDIETFNNVSSLASIKSSLINNNVVLPDMPSVTTNATNNSLSTSNANGKVPFFEEGFNNATLYYKRVTCFDWDRKLAYSISSEKAITGITSYVDSSNIGKAGNLSSTVGFVNATVGKGLLDIIYRGSATGSYDKVTKVPVCMGSNLLDMGTHILGVATENRTAGDIDTFNVVTECKRIGNNVEFVSNTQPTVGNFIKGDRCINSIITSGGVKGWIYNGSSWIIEGNYPS